jgi:1-acyl-sn-glycerol-3-phosphate acyltransferase
MFNMLFYAGMFVIAILCLPLSHKPAVARAALSFVANYGILLLKVVCGLGASVRGKLADAPTLYVANHESAWEVFFLWYYIPNPCFVLKEELIAIPLIGRYLRVAGNIAIKREQKASAVKTLLAEGKEKHTQGYNLIIFPEGTRMKPGESGRYHPGVAILYKQLELSVVPVAHNAGRYWGKNSFLKYSGEVSAHFLPAIKPGLAKKALLDTLRRDIEANFVS